MGDFECAVKQAIKNPPHDYMRQVCPDQFVGILKDIETNSSEFPCRLPVNDDRVPEKTVLLILESPHKKEFISHSDLQKVLQEALSVDIYPK